MIDLFSPNTAYAADALGAFMSKVDTMIINPLIVLLFALATAFFLFGVFQFIVNAESEEKRTEGKNHMLWGIIGLTVMVGVWAIMNIILNTLNIQGVTPEKGAVQLNDYHPSIPPLGTR